MLDEPPKRKTKNQTKSHNDKINKIEKITKEPINVLRNTNDILSTDISNEFEVVKKRNKIKSNTTTPTIEKENKKEEKIIIQEKDNKKDFYMKLNEQTKDIKNTDNEQIESNINKKEY